MVFPLGRLGSVLLLYSAAICGASANTLGTFDDVRAALLNHPSLQSFQNMAEQTRHLSKAARALPNPTVSVGVNNVPLSSFSFDDFLPTNKAIGVSQTFPSGAGRRANSDRLTAQSALSALEGQAQLAELEAQLIGALADKEAALREKVLLDQQTDQLDDLLEIIDAQLVSGRDVEADRYGIAAQTAAIDRQRAQAQERLLISQAVLTSLVGQDVSVPLPLENADALPAAPRFYAVAIAEAKAAIAHKGVAVAQARFRPDWGMSLTYQQRNGTDAFAGDDWFSAMVTVSVPLWQSANQVPTLKAAEAGRAAAQSDALTVSRMAQAQWRQLGAQVATTQQALTALDAQMAAVRQKVDALRQTYEAGAGGYQAVLQAEIDPLSLKIAAARETSAHIRARAKAKAMMVPQ